MIPKRTGLTISFVGLIDEKKSLKRSLILHEKNLKNT